MKNRTRILVVLLAVWFAGVTAYIAYWVHDLHAKEVLRCMDDTLNAISYLRQNSRVSEANELASRMDAMCERQGNSSFHRQDWIGLAAFYLVPPLVLGLLAFAIAKALRWTRKDLTAPVWKQTALVLTTILVGLVYWTRHAGPADSDDFENCSEQSLNAVIAEQTRKNITYDSAGFYAVVAVADDRCMATKSYEYSGGSGCSDVRYSYCYSRKRTAF
ncbi:hypothetical protein PQR71_13995 [Paraburkholderia fungorum]|uniref:hypothetical protein n=1 Tax=Paraburkholderia fungorum TaxID=134537 RepID=UPI0038BA9DFB